MSAPIIVPEGLLKEDGVELRPISEDDVPAFVEAFGDPAIAMGAYHGQLAGTDEALRPYLKRNSERMEAGEAVLLGVWEAGAPSLSGQTMLFRFDWTRVIRLCRSQHGTAAVGARRGLTA